VRILHLIGTTDFAGTEQMVLTLCQGQMERGHSVAVATRRDARIVEELRVVGVPVLKQHIGSISGIFGIAKHVKSLQIDVLHAHLSSAVNTSNIISFLTGVPILDHLHVYSKDLSHKIASRRGLLVAVSKHTADFYTETVGLEPSKIVFVPNASLISRDPEAHLAKQLANEQICTELGISAKSRFVLVAARITAQKGQDLVIEAAKELRSRFPDVHYLIAGSEEDAPYIASLKQQSEQAKLSDRVHFLGFRRDVARLIRAAEIAAIPSRFEPFSLSTLEPLLLGTPVVAARIGGIPEIIVSDDIGVLVEPDNAPELAAGIAKLLENPELAASISLNALERAQATYSVEALLNRIDEVYGRLTHANHAASETRA
jgi:glycosyltransferase involved in cell wall biosynthesis